MICAEVVVSVRLPRARIEILYGPLVMTDQLLQESSPNLGLTT